MSVTIETNAGELDHHSRPHPFHLSILFPVWLGCCSEDAYFVQEKGVRVKLGPLLATPCVCTNIYPICSESLLPITYQNCQWLPIIYKSFGLVCRVS